MLLVKVRVRSCKRRTNASPVKDRRFYKSRKWLTFLSRKESVLHGYAITIPGEGDELPDCLSGDLIFMVTIKKHDLFTRVGADLFLIEEDLFVRGSYRSKLQLEASRWHEY